MDGNLIIQFKSENEALQCVAIIDQIAANWWQSQGYSVVDGDLVGKNAATGEDMVASAKTMTWAVPRQSPIGTWYVPSPASNPNFANWRDYLPEGIAIPIDTIMPMEWTQREKLSNYLSPDP